MNDHIDRTAQIISGAMFGLTTESMVLAIAGALDAAGLLASTEHDATVAERAWDEGFTRGFYTGASDQYASEPDVINPYKLREEP